MGVYDKEDDEVSPRASHTFSAPDDLAKKWENGEGGYHGIGHVRLWNRKRRKQNQKKTKRKGARLARHVEK
jgi:hypothetical protein